MFLLNQRACGRMRMNNMKMDPVKRAVWEEIARDLSGSRKSAVALCSPVDFRRFLAGVPGIPFLLEDLDPGKPAPREEGSRDLFIGWHLVGEEDDRIAPETIYGLLRKGGEARLFGFYLHPRPDDLREWESRIRRGAEPAEIRSPLPGAIGIGRISGWLKDSPFVRYVIRKKGLYYQAILSKES